PKIDAKFLGEAKYSQASVLHPLPRVGELDAKLDSDTRAVYFEQAAYGVPIRMALISLLLGLYKGKSLAKFQGGFSEQTARVYDQPFNVGISCSNNNCIVHDPMESPYVRNKFHIVKSELRKDCKLRCFYCESDIEQFVVASKKNRWFTDDTSALLKAGDLRDIIVFAQSTQAEERGFHCRRHPVKQKNSHQRKSDVQYGT
ncbi:MAG: hypothetical protein WB677_00540, partial [Xanthobacteraceae bacterium]